MAALWAAEAGIYGRFGYAPASRRGAWRGDPTRLRLRPDVPTGTGTVGPATSSGSATLADGTTPASIGRREDGASFTNGVTRRVLMRNVVLTPAEIAQEYAHG